MKDKNICVLGLGYIGLPTSLILCENGFNVHGVDINVDYSNFKNFTNFQYYAIKNLTNVDLNNNVQTKNLGVNLDKYKVKRSKLFATKLRLWLDDFYIGGKDLYSKHSITMIKCSQLFRLQQTNYNHII